MIDKVYEEEQEADVIHAGCNYVSVSVLARNLDIIGLFEGFAMSVELRLCESCCED